MTEGVTDEVTEGVTDGVTEGVTGGVDDGCKEREREPDGNVWEGEVWAEPRDLRRLVPPPEPAAKPDRPPDEPAGAALAERKERPPPDCALPLVALAEDDATVGDWAPTRTAIPGTPPAARNEDTPATAKTAPTARTGYLCRKRPLD